MNNHVINSIRQQQYSWSELSKYIKNYMKKIHIIRHSIKTYEKIKRKLFLKTPNFSSSKDSFMSWSEWIHNECIPWASSLRLHIYIYKHIYTNLYKIFVFCLFDHFACKMGLQTSTFIKYLSFWKHESFARLIDCRGLTFLTLLWGEKLVQKCKILLPPINIPNK
jgi:hypothetical protein